MISADYADPDWAGKLLALRAGAGFGPFGATVVIGQHKASGFSAQTVYGGSVAMKLFGGGLVPVSISAQAGVGQLKISTPLGSTTVTSMPVGAAVRASIPLFPLKPFAVGYYILGNSQVTKEFRATIGADFNLLLGVGAHAAYDIGTASGSGKTWAVGAHFNFRLPIPL
jgi:hypothetical protein